jgi:ornithine cyclodeaminase/alanine dehydrogenase-like protein (mu-crystallin family)
MLILSAEQIRALVPLPHLIDCLRETFRYKPGTPTTSPRQVIKLPGGAGDRLLLSMPAFSVDGVCVVKLATVCSENQAIGLPTIQAVILMFSETGTPIALLDGEIVTHLRTGATSALASTYLSREDSSHLVIIGTGALAPTVAAAHCAVRQITRVSVCGRRSERAKATAEAIRSLVSQSVTVLVSDSIEKAVATADIVSCATASVTPILAGKWLRAGTFVDLVGSFSPNHRESDDDVLLRSRIFVDTFDGALAEAGDLLIPLACGVIDPNRIEGELSDLVSERVAGRVADHEIIAFKSVGTAIEDLAASRFAVGRCSQWADYRGSMESGIVASEP